MNNREVKTEIENIINVYYPDFAKSDELMVDIQRCIDIAKFELDIPNNMAIMYVRNIVTGYRLKVEKWQMNFTKKQLV